MASPIYLSIDLDYWNGSRTGQAEKFFRVLFRNLGKTRPFKVVLDHHHLLPHIHDVGKAVRTLVNIDFHDDFAERSKNCPEGAWVSQVPWKKGSTYIWRCPTLLRCVHDSQGLCQRVPWNMEDNTLGWKRVVTKQGIGTVDWRRVVGVGISVSPFYLAWGKLGQVPKQILRRVREPWIEPNAVLALERLVEAKTWRDLPPSYGVAAF